MGRGSLRKLFRERCYSSDAANHPGLECVGLSIQDEHHVAFDGQVLGHLRAVAIHQLEVLVAVSFDAPDLPFLLSRQN